MEEDLEITDAVVIRGAELGFTASRASGPGGQHVNKASTRVTLAWDVGGSGSLSSEHRALVEERLAGRIGKDGVLRISAEDTRSQSRNREIARERLAALVREAIKVEKERIPTKPTPVSRKRRVDEKKRRGEVKRLRSGPDPEE